MRRIHFTAPAVFRLAAAGVTLAVLGLLVQTTPFADAVLPTNEPGGIAKVVAGYDCLTASSPWQLSDSPTSDLPPAGAPPAGFAAVAAYQCSDNAAVEDEDGVWSAIAVTRHEGDLTTLLAALALEPRAVDEISAGTATEVATCPFTTQLVPLLWLVDAAGAAIHVQWPVDGCGKILSEASAALAALGIAEYDTLRNELLTPRVALDLGCPATSGAPYPLELAQQVGPTDPPLFAATELTWCRYTVHPADETEPAEDGQSVEGDYPSFEFIVGTFTTGGTLTGDNAARVVTAASPLARVGACSGEPTDFVRLRDTNRERQPTVIHTFWLDGCSSSASMATSVTALPGDLTNLFEE